MSGRQPNLLERALSAVTEVRAGEGARAVAMGAAVFLLLSAYYVVKTVREPMLLATGSAELKAYASAGQAMALLVFVPLYGRLSARLPRGALIIGVSAFVLPCLQFFYPFARRAAATDAVDATREVTLANFASVGFIFYVWVGIFSLATVAQFWSFANDIYTKKQGLRLFPLIGVGATSGAAVGALIPGFLRNTLGVGTAEMLQAASVLLIAHAGLLYAIHRTVSQDAQQSGAEVPPALEAGSGFGLLLKDSYLLLIAVVILLLNLVNTLWTTLFVTAALASFCVANPAHAFDRVQPTWGDAGFLMVAVPLALALEGVPPAPHTREPVQECARASLEIESATEIAVRRSLDCRVRDGGSWRRPQTAAHLSDARLYSFLTAPAWAPVTGQSAWGDGPTDHSGVGTMVGYEAMAATYVVTGLFKHTVRRIRPGGIDGDYDDAFASFPSGHSSMSFSGATLLTIYAYEYGWAAPGRRWLVPVTAYSAAAFTAYLRIGARKHWLTDVLVGALVGTGTTLVTHAVRL